MCFQSLPGWWKLANGSCEACMLRQRAAIATTFLRWLHSLVMSCSALPNGWLCCSTLTPTLKLKTCMVRDETGLDRIQRKQPIIFNQSWGHLHKYFALFYTHTHSLRKSKSLKLNNHSRQVSLKRIKKVFVISPNVKRCPISGRPMKKSECFNISFNIKFVNSDCQRQQDPVQVPCPCYTGSKCFLVVWGELCKIKHWFLCVPNTNFIHIHLLPCGWWVGIPDHIYRNHQSTDRSWPRPEWTGQCHWDCRERVGRSFNHRGRLRHLQAFTRLHTQSERCWLLLGAF